VTITLCHYPPGASKWNPIEHRLFSEISKNWQAKPLVTIATMLNYIRTTTTVSGLRVNAENIRKASAFPTSSSPACPSNETQRCRIGTTNFLLKTAKLFFPEPLESRSRNPDRRSPDVYGLDPPCRGGDESIFGGPKVADAVRSFGDLLLTPRETIDGEAAVQYSRNPLGW
jgi:hypothetical protein